MYRTGQLIKARVKLLPFIFHYGIILVESGNTKVIHNTTDRSTVIDDIEYWSSQYNIDSVTNTSLIGYSEDYIRSRFKTVCKRDYSLFNYNCEHFINCMLGHDLRSSQLRLYLTILGITTFNYLRRSKKLNNNNLK